MSVSLWDNQRILKSIFSYFLILLSFALEIIGIIYSDENVLLLATCLIWTGLFIKNLHRENFTVLVFCVTFFTFLMSTLVIRCFDSSVELRVSKHETLVHMYISLYVSLFFLNVGTYIARNMRFSISKHHRDGVINLNDIDRIQRASKVIYLLTSICAMAVSFEKAIYVIIGGDYTSYYVDFISVLPSIFNRISDMNTYAFYIFLATLPDPRNSKLLFSIYLIDGVLGLLYGQRNQIVMVVIMLCIYVVLYENREQKPYSILKRKYVVLGLILIPFVLVFLDFIKYSRDSMAFKFDGIWESIKDLFSSLGGSVNVIGQGYELMDAFPKGHLYSFGGVIDFLTKNVLLRPILGTTIYNDNTIEMALYGNSYGQTISYLGWGPTLYLAGRGMGSCFIAEAFHDLGFLGIGLFSSVYGIILTKVNKLQKGYWIRNAIVLIALYHILYAPRDSAGSFISAFFNYSFIATVLIIYFFSRCLKTKNNE